MLECMTIEQRVQQFDLKHGSDAIYVDGWKLFSDGAKRHPNSSGVMCEPPDNPQERCKLQVLYHEGRLRRATEAFQEQKRNLRRAAESCSEGPAPQALVCDEQLQKLKDLQQTVRECQTRLNEARKELGRGKPNARGDYETRLAANRERGEQFIEALNQIQI